MQAVEIPQRRDDKLRKSDSRDWLRSSERIFHMPAYNAQSPPKAVYPGDEETIVNAEQLGANNASQQVAIPIRDVVQGPVSVTFSYASPPAAVSYDVQVANDDAAANYLKIGNTTNVNGDRIDINTLAGGFRFRFLRVVERTSPGVNATIKLLG
jgi:hypothetical protein